MKLKGRDNMVDFKKRLRQRYAVDLFCGGGGLTVGLKRAGFQVVGAVENEPHAFATYKANHPEVNVFFQDIRTVKGECLLKLAPEGIDLVAGCPPCQGFCSLTTKYRYEDPRNKLVWEMSRLIEEIRPKAVMMENVPGLIKKGKDIFDLFVKKLSDLGYFCKWKVLQFADYGVPQSRHRLVLLAGYGFEINIPSPTHSKNPTKGMLPWRTVRNVIYNMPSPVTLSESIRRGGPQAFNWHVTRDLSEINKKRLKVAQPGKSRASIPRELRPTCHQTEDKGFGNVYGRMSWDNVSPTITGGCTTLSKGRFGHPDELRTISVREAAMLQTLPRDYIIATDYMDKACNIIGNALPCDFAEVLARECINTLDALSM